MKATPPSHTLCPDRRSGRFSPAGGLTAGGRLTLLVIVTGLILLAQAWQATHRYGQHTSTRNSANVHTVELQPRSSTSKQ